MHYRHPVKNRLPSSAIIELIDIRIDVILVQLLYTHINTWVGGWRGGGGLESTDPPEMPCVSACKRVCLEVLLWFEVLSGFHL